MTSAFPYLVWAGLAARLLFHLFTKLSIVERYWGVICLPEACNRLYNTWHTAKGKQGVCARGGGGDLTLTTRNKPFSFPSCPWFWTMIKPMNISCCTRPKATLSFPHSPVQRDGSHVRTMNTPRWSATTQIATMVGSWFSASVPAPHVLSFSCPQRTHF